MARSQAWTQPGFEVVDHPGARVLTRPEAVPWVRYVLEGGESLHDAAARTRDALVLEGRAPLYVIPAKIRREEGAPDSGRWAVRHYVRGGRLVSRLLGDRYLKWGRLRPFREVRASEIARARGIPTPRVMAAAIYPSRLLYRADLITEFIPRAVELIDALFDTERKGAGGAQERQDALRAAGKLIGALAGAGIRHRDLHAGNILLRWEGAAPHPHLLDLDRCEVGRRGETVTVEPMLGRLQRSLKKWERRTGLALSEREWAALKTTARE